MPSLRPAYEKLGRPACGGLGDQTDDSGPIPVDPVPGDLSLDHPILPVIVNRSLQSIILCALHGPFQCQAACFMHLLAHIEMSAISRIDLVECLQG